MKLKYQKSHRHRQVQFPQGALGLLGGLASRAQPVVEDSKFRNSFVDGTQGSDGRFESSKVGPREASRSQKAAFEHCWRVLHF